MKKSYFLLLSGLYMLLVSCQSPNEKPGDYKLLPLPQQLDVHGISGLKYDDIQHYLA
jgi:hypothetical protein